MRKITALVATLLFALLFQIAPAHAAMRASDDSGTTVTIGRAPCLNVFVLSQVEDVDKGLAAAGLPTITADSMHQAGAIYQGKPYDACWFAVGPRAAVILDGDLRGQMLLIPGEAFREVEGI